MMDIGRAIGRVGTAVPLRPDSLPPNSLVTGGTAMNYTDTILADRLVLVLSGRLTFADAAHFPEIVDRIRGNGSAIVEIDMAALEFLDSSGLGLILTAYDAAHRAGMQMAIRNARGHVLDGLKRARFDHLMAVC